MALPSPLDDPRTAAHAWARWRWLMKLMLGVTAAVVLAVCAYLYWAVGLVSIHFYIAAALGITVSMLLMAALMGLVFLSSGTGHDEAIEDPLEDERRR